MNRTTSSRLTRLATNLLIALAAPAAALEIDFEDRGANLPIDGNAFYDGRSEVDASDPDATDFETQGATFPGPITSVPDVRETHVVVDPPEGLFD